MREANPIHPPKWPLRLLRFFLKPEYLEEIEGDLEETFLETAEKTSVTQANRQYAWEAIRLLRTNLLRKPDFLKRLTPAPMFTNYVKVSVRGLLKSPLNSFINLFGLAAAISVAVFGYAIWRFTFSRDQFHENKAVVFLVTTFANREGTLNQYGTTPRPLGELLKEDFAQVKRICRVEDRPAIVKSGDNVFNERIRFTDPSFLQLFTFPLKWGVSATLTDLNSIILSEPMSEKYFGSENPIGQSILIRFDKERSKLFTVTGVAQAFPSSRSMDFHFLIHIDNLLTLQPNYDPTDWASTVQATLFQVAQPSDTALMGPHMEKYLALQRAAVPEDRAIRSFRFEPLERLHLRADQIRDGIFRGGSKDNIISVMFLAGICILLLVLACFNYINMAIVSAARRLKELGIRKTIGATRRVIIVQYLSENLVISFFALALGLLLGRFVVIPWFEGLWHFSMEFKFLDPNLWIYLPIVLFVTGIASGIYPALFISRFQTVDILKGGVRFGTRSFITQALLAIQLVLACVFVTSAVMFTQNNKYLSQRSWGYDNKEVVYAVGQDALALEQLQAVMERNAHVVSAAYGKDHVGRKHQSVVLRFPDRELNADLLEVSGTYLETMGISLVKGRTFHQGETADRQAVVVNETLVGNMGWADPVGEQFHLDSVRYEVVGVVRDFHSYNFENKLKPMVIRLAAKEDSRYLALRVSPRDKQEAFGQLQQAWAGLFPETPFNGGYQEEVWGPYYTQIGIYGHVWRVFASTAVLLAFLGLYGLVSFSASGRIKEFSIRKVMGADLFTIGSLLLRQYYSLFGLAMILGLPLSYYAIKWVLDMSSNYHAPVTFWGVSLAGLLLVVVLLGTVLHHVVRVNRSNPLQNLRSE